MKNKNLYLSVVIPCYNEGENLKRGVLDEVDNYLKKQKYQSEVIVSDDGSTDNSVELVEKFLKKYSYFKLLKNKHGGKPFAVRAGIEKAKGEIILFTDMDQSTPLNQIERLLPYFNQDFEVVIGSRGAERKGFNLIRQIASTVFRLIRQALLLPEIKDTQCGFKAFKSRAAKAIFPQLLVFKTAKITRRPAGWNVSAFDVELLFIAQKRGYKIAEVPISWRERDLAAEAKKKKSSFLKESSKMFKEVLRVKLNDLKGVYD